MAKAQGLKGALNRFKGVNHKLEQQKKFRKTAEKRKRAQAAENGDEIETAIEAEPALNGSLKANKKNSKQDKAAAAAQQNEDSLVSADGWESDEDDDDEMEDDNGVGIGALEDESDSDSEDEIETTAVPNRALNGSKRTSQAAEGEEEEDEEEEDVPYSDIESLASEDRADVVPHQRLTINNTAALQRALHSIALSSKLPFSAVQSVTSAEPTTIADVDDDLNRELAFYRQSLEAVSEARKLLKKEGAAFSRPADYFAEMVKSEEQMGKVKQKLVDEAARKKASADARRQRDLKKFGKAVQTAKLQERAKEKRDTLDRINTLKRKRQGADLTANEDDLFDVALDDAADSAKPDRAARRGRAGPGGAPSTNRAKKDAKFGFGGKKRFSKSNDAKSTGDLSSYSVKKMKGGSKGGKPRPGKSKRARL